jgi:hypothetical protein
MDQQQGNRRDTDFGSSNRDSGFSPHQRELRHFILGWILVFCGSTINLAFADL